MTTKRRGLHTPLDLFARWEKVNCMDKCSWDDLFKVESNGLNAIISTKLEDQPCCRFSKFSINEFPVNIGNFAKCTKVNSHGQTWKYPSYIFSKTLSPKFHPFHSTISRFPDKTVRVTFWNFQPRIGPVLTKFQSVIILFLSVRQKRNSLYNPWLSYLQWSLVESERKPRQK